MTKRGDAVRQKTKFNIMIIKKNYKKHEFDNVQCKNKTLNRKYVLKKVYKN